MAKLRFTVQTIEVATTTSKKTVLQIKAPTNQKTLVREVSISFKGVLNGDPPILVEILRQSTAGSGGSACNPVKAVTSDPETIQTTGQQDVGGSTQPTDTNCEGREEVHPQGGGFLWQAPFGDELIVNGAEYLGVAVTASRNINCVARFRCEE